MTENRSRGRKVTRKAAPPSAETAAQSDAGNAGAEQQRERSDKARVSNAEAATVFNDGGQQTAQNSGAGEGSDKGGQRSVGDSNGDNNGGNGGGPSRKCRLRGRGASHRANHREK